MDVRQIAVVSANLGSFDKPNPGAITDKEYPPRTGAMTSRLQARIVKMFMWQFAPESKYYLWVDSSCKLEPGAKEWFMQQLGDADIAVFKHNRRDTVQEEADYLKHRLAIDCPYITPRYAGEDIDGQLAEVDPDAELYASTAFIYKDSRPIRRAMKEWWYHTSRYHSIDQLSFPWVIKDLEVNVIDEDYLKCKYLTYVRNQK